MEASAAVSTYRNIAAQGKAYPAPAQMLEQQMALLVTERDELKELLDEQEASGRLHYELSRAYHDASRAVADFAAAIAELERADAVRVVLSPRQAF